MYAWCIPENCCSNSLTFMPGWNLWRSRRQNISFKSLTRRDFFGESTACQSSQTQDWHPFSLSGGFHVTLQLQGRATPWRRARDRFFEPRRGRLTGACALESNMSLFEPRREEPLETADYDERTALPLRLVFSSATASALQ